MKAAILQCDNVLDKFQTEFGNYPAMIIRMFSQLETPPEFDVYDCQKGELPTDINDYDFFITTGSKASVYDGLAWVEQLVAFIQMLDQSKKTLIGICFGHQLIAMARGLKVKKSVKGWGIGIAKNHVLTQPVWMKERPATLNILASHQDQIADLPDTVQIIAASDFCPYFVVQWSAHFLSVQGHPEWENEYSHALINNRRAIIPADIIEQGLKSLTTKPDNELFVNWVMEFVRRSRLA